MMDARSALRPCNLVALGIAVFAVLVPFACQAQPATREDRARGEIRLAAPLSSVPSNLAVSPDGRFVLSSTVDGSVSTFDLTSRYGQTGVLMSAPIRDEELQKQRPIALSPSGELVALGVPLERNVANSARVHLFKRSDSKSIIYTIDHLPSRPFQLAFVVDGQDLLLIALFADKQQPRMWNVSKIRDAARDTTGKRFDPDKLKPDEDILPEPVKGFFENCGRSECHSLGIAFAKPDSGVRLVVAGDSGIVLYDNNFEVAAYGYVGDGRKDLQRASGISFSPDGKRVAISRRDLGSADRHANDACAVHIYDFDALRATGPDRRITALPLFRLDPGEHKGEEVCFFSHVVWAGEAIFAAGDFVAPPPPAGPRCRTFSELDTNYHPYAMMLVRWDASRDAQATHHCLGTNIAMDLQPIAGGGVVAVTPDPALTVFDNKGNESTYPAQPSIPRYFDGPIFDFRDGSRGALMTNTDGSIVMLRPLAVPRPYVAFDLRPPENAAQFISVTGADLDTTKADLLKLLEPHRTQEISFAEKLKGGRECLGVAFPENGDALNGPRRTALTAALKDSLKFRPIERALTFQFLSPAAGESEWQIVIGTTHRLIYARCDGQDLWNDTTIAQADVPGTRIRNEVYQLAVSGDRRFLIAAHADGLLRWYRMAGGQHVLSVFLRPDLRSWIAWNTEGYFDYSFTGGSQIAGWVQSTPTGGGAWRVDSQPLGRFDEKWHKPDRVQSIFADAESGRSVTKAEQAPETGRAQLQMKIVDGDKIVSPAIRLNIRASNASQGAMDSPLFVSIEGMADVAFQKPPVLRREGQDVVINASFELPACLRHPGKSHRLSARFEGGKESTYVTYIGPDSGVTDCPQRRIWGIAVGISKYKTDDQMLNYADQDAQRFFEFWNSHGFYKVGRFALLTAPRDGAAKTLLLQNGARDERPLAAADNTTVRKFITSELEQIRDEIKKLRDEAKKAGKDATADDLVVIYLAGHGLTVKDNTSENWFFMPSNGEASNPKETGFGVQKLVTWLDDLDFKSDIPIMVFLDACRNLNVYPDQTSRTIDRKINPDFIDLLNKYDASVFVASGTAKSAYELPEKDLLKPKQPPDCVASGKDEKGGGAFTHVLLDVLKDPKGQLLLSDLDKRLGAGVKTLCEKQVTKSYIQWETKFPGFFFSN